MVLDNNKVTEIAVRLGFGLAGFARAEELQEESEHLQTWLKKGFQAGMAYMERNTDKRNDVSMLLPGAKSVISLTVNYNTPHTHTSQAGKGKISRYAWGTDYHNIIWEKLDRFIAELKQLDPGLEAVSYVDTGPVMDKAWAVRAGIGWMGKHSNIINPSLGSWMFLATVITNREFSYNKEPVTDYCGTCRRCMEACPTGAIVEERVVDANKCISYLTIENKGEIDESFSRKMEGWLFGCDICQEVCPWNIKFSAVTSEIKFLPRNGETELDLKQTASMEKEEFNERFKESPVKRAKLKGLHRNAEFLMK